MRRLQSSQRDSRSSSACRQQLSWSEPLKSGNCRPVCSQHHTLQPHEKQQASLVDTHRAPQCNSQTSSVSQLVSWSDRRTALLRLLGLGLSPLLGVVPRAAAAEVSQLDSSSSSTGPSALSDPSLDTQQGSQSADESARGAAGQAADSPAADSLQRDDSPSQVIDDDDNSSSSSSESDSSSDSDSDSSSDEEPGGRRAVHSSLSTIAITS